MPILRWLERTRRRWSGGLDPDELDKLAADFAKRASHAGAGVSPGFAALRQVDGLFEVWLAAFRRDLRVALSSRSRNDQLLALRRHAGEYLRRSNDGWRVLEDRRLADSERALVWQLRRAPAFAQALQELGETAKRVPPRTVPEGTAAEAVMTLRYNELVSDGLLGHQSLVLLEGLVKTCFNEELLTEDATRSMDISDAQHLLRFKAAGHSRSEDRSKVGQAVIENHVATCLEAVAHALEASAIRSERTSSSDSFDPLKFEPLEWQQVFLHRPGRRLGDAADRIAALLWAEVEQLLAVARADQPSHQFHGVISHAVSCDLYSALFAAYASGIEVKVADDCRAILSSFARMASSRRLFELANADPGATGDRWRTVEGQALLELQVWFADFEADPVVRATSFAALARSLAGICTLSYFDPMEQVALFALIKYFILQNIISTEGVVRRGITLPPNWTQPYAVYVQREKRLLHTLAVVMSST